MYPRRLLITAGVLAFMVSLVVLAPVAWYLKLAPVAVAQRVSGTTGTVWQGTAVIATNNGPVRVSWDSHPGSLLLFTLETDWTLSGTGLSGSGGLAISPWSRRLAIEHGEVGPERLMGLFPGRGVLLDQPLAVRGLELTMAANGRVESADGRLAWGPGPVQVAGRAEALAVPALHGRVSAVDGHLHVLADGESEPGGMLATLDVDLVARELHLVISQRGAQLVGAAPVSARPPDTPFFELKQPLH